MGATEVTLVAITVTLFVLYLWLKWRYSYWTRQGIPQLPPKFFYGNCKETVDNNENIGITFDRIYKRIKQRSLYYGGAYMFFKQVFIPVHPTILKTILQKEFSHFPGTGAFYHKKDLLGQHLLTLEGEKWKSLRTKLTPAFTTAKIKLMFEGMVNKATDLARVLETYAQSNQVFEAKDLATRYTTDVIVTTAFGIECDSLQDPNNPFKKSVERLLDKGKFSLLITDIVPWSILGNLGWKFVGSTEFENFFIDVIKRATEVREKANVYRKDFFQMLLQLKNKGVISDDGDITEISNKGTNTLTETEVAAQAFLFYFGGYETTATTISFALLNLAQYPDIQDKVREEIRDALEHHNGEFTYEAAMEMEYLDKVIHETLRMYPPFRVYSRICAKDYRIPDSNAKIQKGTQIVIPVGGIHYDPEYYPNPEVFNPENFSKENKAKRPDCTFLAFGDGPRMCIGMRFGLVNAKVGVATIIKDHVVTINKKTVLPIVVDSEKFVTTARDNIWLEVAKAD